MKKAVDKVEIRSFVEEDIPFKVAMINDKKNNTFLHYDLPLEENKSLDWFKKIKNNGDRLDLTIVYDGKVAGLIGLLGVDKKNKKAEYYICVDNSFSGRGIGTVATNILLEHAFNGMGLNKVYLFTEKDNIGAQRLFEKIGFSREGLLKNDIIYNNRLVSRYAYGLCKEDYDARNTNS